MDQLLAVEKMSGIKPKELVELPTPDPTILYLVDIFYQVKRELGVKITYSELQSYCMLSEVILEPDEVEVIMKLDNRLESGR